MDKKFVLAVFDLECNWEGIPPVYRVYLNGELFTERSWRWDSNYYLKQILQIEAVPGRYQLEVESIAPCVSQITIDCNAVEHGDAHWEENNVLVIE